MSHRNIVDKCLSLCSDVDFIRGILMYMGALMKCGNLSTGCERITKFGER